MLAYLVSITLRVAEIHRVLKHTGSFYLHCNPTASHYIKLVLDAVFCSLNGNFQNEIIWCYSIGGKSQNRFGRKHDVIFYYTKSNEYTFNDKAASISRRPNSHMKVRVDSVGRQYQEKTDKKTGKIYKYYLDQGKIKAKIVLKVKSAPIKPSEICELYQMMNQKQAAIAILITLEEPSPEMVKEAKVYGMYQNKTMGYACSRIQVVTIREILEEGKRLDTPLI